jgi:hypothetical protein
MKFPDPKAFSPSPSPLPCPALPPTIARCSPGLRSPPGFSPNSPSPWPIHRKGPKASTLYRRRRRTSPEL